MAWLAYHANIVESRSIWWVELEAALSVPSTVPMINGWKIFHLISIKRTGRDVQGLDTNSCDDDSREWEMEEKATQWFDDDLFVILKYFRLLERKEERFMSIEKLCKAFAFLIFFSFYFPLICGNVDFSSYLDWERKLSKRLSLFFFSLSTPNDEFRVKAAAKSSIDIERSRAICKKNFFSQEWIQLLCDDVRINHEEIRFFRSNFHKIDVDSSKSVNLRFKFKWYEWLPRHMELMM